MQPSIFSKMIPINKRNAWLMLQTAMACLFTMHLLSTNAGRYLGTLILVTWAFIWFPVVLSYIGSLLLCTKEFVKLTKGLNYDLSIWQRFFAIFVGNCISIFYLSKTKDAETLEWFGSVLIFIGLPIQLLLICLFELLFHIHSKNKS